MRSAFFSFTMVSLLTSLLCNPTISTAAEMSPSPWIFHRTVYSLNKNNTSTVTLRTGYFLEAENTPFKGCILYIEGLADSVVNHAPLFYKLSQNGYRVVFFDYMGQGGSGGTMNDTRILSTLSKEKQISSQAQFVWNKYLSEKDDVYSRSCSQSKNMVLGWSTGGLATYGLAHEGWAEAVVLIAPGIHPKKFVGEAAKRPHLMFTLGQVITERTLTRNKYDNTVNPHFDAIKPISPAVVPLFSANLLFSANRAQKWMISNKVQGLVFLSGVEDTYVDRIATEKTLKVKAPHFKTVSYDGALHEIDNEISEVANDLHDKTVEFFNSFVRSNQ